jgi:hypothetical protein
VLITSNEQSMAELGAAVAVNMLTAAEAQAFLAGRTGSADTAPLGLVVFRLACTAGP